MLRLAMSPHRWVSAVNCVDVAQVASIMGWSASTTAKMAKRYGHIGEDARRAALNALVSTPQRVLQPDEAQRAKAADTAA